MVIQPELVAVFFGILSAVAFGSGDFIGGMATRRISVITVVLVVEIVGFVLMLALALVTAEPIRSSSDLIWGALAALAGTSGILTLYRAFAGAKMGLVAPLSAALAAAVPALFGMLTEGIPGTLKLIGFGLALVSIWLVSRSNTGSSTDTRSLMLAIAAGILFGLFFIMLGQIQPGAVFWPLVASRFMSLVYILVIALWNKNISMPSGKTFVGMMILGGSLDIIGNVFFVIANASGRLDITAVLSSLYPAMTVILARFVLKEKLSRIQAVGVLIALVAIVLIVL